MTAVPSWLVPPATIELSAPEVHLWRADLDELSRSSVQLEDVLSPEEMERAGRFRFDRDRKRFVAGRAALRDILARYLGAQPDELRFRYGSAGRPQLASIFADSDLDFNLAHSGPLALYAVAAGRRVGVDLELCAAMPEAEQVAGAFLSDREMKAWIELRPGERIESFYRYWTLKEALLKATGDGLSRGPQQIELSLSRESASLLSMSGDSGAAERWGLQELAIEPAYAAGLAVEGQRWDLLYWQLQE